MSKPTLVRITYLPIHFFINSINTCFCFCYYIISGRKYSNNAVFSLFWHLHTVIVSIIHLFFYNRISSIDQRVTFLHERKRLGLIRILFIGISLYVTNMESVLRDLFYDFPNNNLINKT